MKLFPTHIVTQAGQENKGCVPIDNGWKRYRPRGHCRAIVELFGSVGLDSKTIQYCRCKHIQENIEVEHHA